jgi:CPA2 family monovalent cation:H+ antiporter-2
LINHVEILLIFTTAVVIVWLFRKLKLPTILAYLAAGVLVGEFGLGLVKDNGNYEHLAELGIVFLLFTLGLEFSLPRLLAMKRLVFAVGSLQVAVSLLVFTLLALLFGLGFSSAFVVGGILALSSTAIVIRQLSETGAMKRKSGQLSVAILLFQDVAVVPLLIVIPMLAVQGDSSLLSTLAFAMLKGISVVILLLFIGKWLLPKIFDVIAQVRTDELFVLTTLLVILLASAITQWFGLSMALGAFLAGMMLGESEYKYQLEADIRPYRDILLGLFFITVGMKLDIFLLLSSPIKLLLFMASFMLIKIFIIKALAVRAGQIEKDAWASGIMLAQMGEFGFVLIALANQSNILPVNVSSMLLGAGVISMAVTPYMVENARSWGRFLSQKNSDEHKELQTLISTEKLSDHVIICGFGRVGQTVSRFLKQDNIPFVAIDTDPLRTSKARDAGEHVLFGSSRQTELLKAANLDEAKLVVIAFGEDRQSIEVIKKVRSLSETVPILVRTRNDDQFEVIKRAGANEVVPESLEGSLMLVSQVLALTGVPFARVIRRVQKERKNHYNHLHGFFQGEDTDLSATGMNEVEIAHALTIQQKSYACGKSIACLKLKENKVDVVSIRRQDKEIIDPEDGMIIIEDDTLVIRGKVRKIKKADKFIRVGP